VDSFATPAQLAQFAGTTYDPGRAELLLSLASAEIRAYCGWHITPQRAETVILDGTGATILSIPTTHLVDVDSVTVHGISVTGYQWSAIGTLALPKGWPSEPRSITAAITHGYDGVPLDVLSVCLTAVLRTLAIPVHVVSESAGSESVTYRQLPASTGGISLVDSEKTVLDRYHVHWRP
jgi:hypothetical protein